MSTARLFCPEPEMPALRPLRVGVLVDLALTPDAGGQVKCWQRLAEAAVDCADRLDLTVHFSGPEPRQIALSPTVRYVLLPPVPSTARLISGVPDHTDLAPWHPKLARALHDYDVVHTTDAFFCYAQTAMRFARRHGIPLVSSIHTNTPEYARITTARLLERVLGSGRAYRAAKTGSACPTESAGYSSGDWRGILPPPPRPWRAEPSRPMAASGTSIAASGSAAASTGRCSPPSGATASGSSSG
jgi:hypothetical protein